jgi:hypothetical protein
MNEREELERQIRELLTADIDSISYQPAGNYLFRLETRQQPK